jgi:hypothetical protein
MKLCEFSATLGSNYINHKHKNSRVHNSLSLKRSVAPVTWTTMPLGAYALGRGQTEDSWAKANSLTLEINVC